MLGPAGAVCYTSKPLLVVPEPLLVAQHTLLWCPRPRVLTARASVAVVLPSCPDVPTPPVQEDAQELADPIRLARLIKQYSQFIQFPIKLWSAKKEAKQVSVFVDRQCKAMEAAVCVSLSLQCVYACR